MHSPIFKSLSPPIGNAEKLERKLVAFLSEAPPRAART